MAGCSSNQEVEIKIGVERFYSGYDGNFRTVDTTMISEKLAGLIRNAIEKEIFEAKKMKESEYPNDKPIMIEGDVFTSFYEGQDSASVEEISLKKQIANVKVLFQNSAYNQSWSDRIILVEENKRWRIDNIIYEGQEQGIADLQSNLKRLIDYESNQ